MGKRSKLILTLQKLDSHVRIRKKGKLELQKIFALNVKRLLLEVMSL